MLKNKKVIALLVLLLALAGYYGYTKSSASINKVEAAEANTTTYTITSMTIGESIDTSGRVKSKNESDVVSKIASESITLKVEIGDNVKAGDILATLDKSDIELLILSKEQQVLEANSNLAALKKEGNLSYKNSYDNAKTTYDTKKKTYDTNIILNDSSSISSLELDNSKADMDKAYNDYQDAKNRYESFDLNGEIKILESSLEIHNKNLDILNRNLDKTTIIAPFDSVVTEVYLADGEAVREGVVVMHLMDISDLIVEVEISEYEVYKLMEGQSVSISPYGNSEKVYKGIVNKVYPSGSTDDDQSYIKVEIGILESDKTLKPGFSVTLNIQISQKDKALVVPYDALIKTGKGYILTKINEDKTNSKVLVETGIESDLFIEVISDELKEGDNVLVMSEVNFTVEKGGLKLPGTGVRPDGGGKRGN
ncbi:MAG: efflux RND transporter periplasmic adaptor subunit [Acidaminobacteraceae bacterium]